VIRVADPLWQFRILLESGAEPGPVRVTVPADAGPGEVAEALDTMFAAEPALTRVTLEVGDQVVGVTSRDVLARLRARAKDAGRGADPGAGDGATLPGHSTNYVVLRFRCPVCAGERRLLFVDDIPTCPAGHGAMERVR
jgi:hypothetical protein